VDYEEARETLRAHRPRPWCWPLLGRLAHCVACGRRWRCQDVREAREYLDLLDPPQLPGTIVRRSDG
jgi:hypothetical protein